MISDNRWLTPLSAACVEVWSGEYLWITDASTVEESVLQRVYCGTGRLREAACVEEQWRREETMTSSGSGALLSFIFLGFLTLQCSLTENKGVPFTLATFSGAQEVL